MKKFSGKKLVRVKMCGSCNPKYDISKMFSQIVSEASSFKFVFEDQKDIDLLLLVSGCQVSCADVKDYLGPKVVVAGFIVQGEEVDPADLVSSVICAMEKAIIARTE